MAEGGETSLTKIFEICGNVQKFCFTIHCHTIKTVFPFYEFQSASFNIILLEAVTHRCVLKKNCSENFCKNYLGKHLHQSIFSKKRPATSLSKTPVFSFKFYEILQGSFFKEHMKSCEWLLLFLAGFWRVLIKDKFCFIFLCNLY